MKKIITLLAVVAMFSFQGCAGPEGPPGQDGFDGYDGKNGLNGKNGSAFDIKNQNLFKNNDNYYSISNTFLDEVNSDLQGSDTVLIYWQSGLNNSGLPVWKLMPQTIYFSNGDKLEFNFDFTVKDYIISAKGNYVLSDRSSYILNQTFRVVIVPVDLISSVNKNNYLEVIKTLKLDESKIQQVQF